MLRLGGRAQISFKSKAFISLQTRSESENMQEILRSYNYSSEVGLNPCNEALITLESLNFLSILLSETISYLLC